MRTTLWLLLLLTGVACGPSLTVEGRPVELMTPRGVPNDAPLPLLILAHGYGVNGTGQDFLFPFSKQVDALQFRYALPSGTQDAAGKRFWNATDACCNFAGLARDDVAYFRAIVAAVKAGHATTRVYVVGHSNGGFMALRLACDASDVIDGVVSVSGSTWDDFSKCPDGRTIPVLLVHGDADDTIFYDGREGLYPSARETADRFARRAGCTPSWAGAGRADFVDDATEETRLEDSGCEKGLALWTMEGVGHAPVFDDTWTTRVFGWLKEHAP